MRELENTVRKALLNSRGYAISEEMIAEALAASAGQTRAAGAAAPFVEDIARWLEEARRGEIADVHRRVVAAAEQALFSQALALADGNLTKAAQWLGISRLTLREKLVAYGMRSKAEEP